MLKIAQRRAEWKRRPWVLIVGAGRRACVIQCTLGSRQCAHANMTTLRDEISLETRYDYCGFDMCLNAVTTSVTWNIIFVSLSAPGGGEYVHLICWVYQNVGRRINITSISLNKPQNAWLCFTLAQSGCCKIQGCNMIIVQKETDEMVWFVTYHRFRCHHQENYPAVESSFWRTSLHSVLSIYTILVTHHLVRSAFF